VRSTRLNPNYACSVEDETRNGHQSANRNPNRSHDTIVLGLFSTEKFEKSHKTVSWFRLDFDLHSDHHFEPHLPRNGLYHHHASRRTKFAPGKSLSISELSSEFEFWGSFSSNVKETPVFSWKGQNSFHRIFPPYSQHFTTTQISFEFSGFYYTSSSFLRHLGSFRWGWVFLERTRILSGIQFTTYFIEIFVVETKRFVDSFVNVILTRQTCGQRSNRVAESKHRVIGNYFPERICQIFLISKCRGNRDLGLCTTSVLAFGEPQCNGKIRGKKKCFDV